SARGGSQAGSRGPAGDAGGGFHAPGPRRAPMPGQAAQAHLGDAALGPQLCPQGLSASGSQPVGTAPVLTIQRLDEPAGFEPAERLVHRARRQAHTGEGFDILGQGVAVLGSVGQTGPDQGGWTGRSAQGSRIVTVARGRPDHGTHSISASDRSATGIAVPVYSPVRDRPSPGTALSRNGPLPERPSPGTALSRNGTEAGRMTGQEQIRRLLIRNGTGDFAEGARQEAVFGLVASEFEGFPVGLGRFGGPAEAAQEIRLGGGQVPVPGEVPITFQVRDPSQPGLGAFGHGQGDRTVKRD